MNIFLDDVRNPPEMGDYVICRNSADAIRLILTGNVRFISFDHDLGQDDTGYIVACKIEELAYNGMIAPIDYMIHSANPVGRDNIRRAMESAWRFWEIGD